MAVPAGCSESSFAINPKVNWGTGTTTSVFFGSEEDQLLLCLQVPETSRSCTRSDEYLTQSSQPTMKHNGHSYQRRNQTIQQCPSRLALALSDRSGYQRCFTFGHCTQVSSLVDDELGQLVLTTTNGNSQPTTFIKAFLCTV